MKTLMPVKEDDKKTLLKILIYLLTEFSIYFLMLPSRIHFYLFPPKVPYFYDSLLIHVAQNQKSLRFPDIGSFKIRSISQF